MRFLIQRVTEASVTIDNAVYGEIGQGFVVFLGIGQGDTRETADVLIRKLLKLRIFADENGKTNRALEDIGGNLLLISQFTLYADCRHGNRPGFTDAADPGTAEELYQYILEECKKSFPKLAHGEFGADMKIRLINDGPFTIILDSRDLC